MIIADGKPLDPAAKLSFKLGIADFAIKLKTTA
jgi:hypothetical protein